MTLTLSLKVFIMGLCFIMWGKGHILMKLIQNEASTNDSHHMPVFFFEKPFPSPCSQILLFAVKRTVLKQAE